MDSLSSSIRAARRHMNSLSAKIAAQYGLEDDARRDFKDLLSKGDNVMSDNAEFNRKKAESVIRYMVDYIENVEEDDLTVEEVAQFLEWEGEFADILSVDTFKAGQETYQTALKEAINKISPVLIESKNDFIITIAEARAVAILVHAAQDNSRLEYDDDDVYEIARIIRKRNNGGGAKNQPLSLNDKKAAAILDYLLTNCNEFEEGDFTAEEIAKILDNNTDKGVDETAREIFDNVQRENSRFVYSDDDVYELTRIIRKRRMDT